MLLHVEALLGYEKFINQDYDQDGNRIDFIKTDGAREGSRDYISYINMYMRRYK